VSTRKRLVKPIGQRINRALDSLGYKVVESDTWASKNGLAKTFRKLKFLGLRPSTIIDAGAHTGTWTQSAIQEWPDAEYHLIEPQNSLLLQIPRNTKNRINLYACGLAQQSGKRSFYHSYRSDSSGFHSRVDSSTRIETVDCYSLDDFVSKFLGNKTPDIIKLDCEGAETEILQGASEPLNNVPVWFLETAVANPNWENTIENVTATMRAKGYAIFTIEEAARNTTTGCLWTAEVCFVSCHSDLYPKFNKWTEKI
jgi:FkbM family methyltransferase